MQNTCRWKERRDAYAHKLSATMEYIKRAWHEERGLAACRLSYHQHDRQHGQRKAYQHGNTAAYLQGSELWDLGCNRAAARRNMWQRQIK